MPTRSSLGVDRILSRYSLLLKNQNTSFIGDKVLPTATVNHPRGKYYSVTPGFSYAAPGHGLLRNSGASFRRVSTDVSQVDAFDLKEYGIEAPVDDVDREFAGSDALDLRQAATEIAWNTAMIQRERDYASLLFNATTFGGATAALSGSTQWNHGSSNPLDQADEAAEKVRTAVGVPRSELSLLVGAGLWKILRKHPKLTDYFKYTQSGATHLSSEVVATALGIKEIIVGNAVGNTAVEGQAAVNADLWSNDFALFFQKVENPRPFSPHGIGATFSMAGRQAGRIERYREEPRSEIVLASWVEDRVVTSPTCGYLYTDVLA